MQITDRANISQDLAIALREMIVDGRLSPGSRINEVHLAARLGVSRTPLREALGRLVSETALDIVPRRGFFVRELTIEEFEQIYPMRAILDPAALMAGGLVSSKRLDRLDELNRRLLSTADPEKAILGDDAWHMKLLEGCPNQVLLETIRDFMRRTRRYELAYMRQRRNVQAAGREHEEIIAALRAGDLPQACDALRRNMQSGRQPIRDWLARRRSPDPAGEGR